MHIAPRSVEQVAAMSEQQTPLPADSAIVLTRSDVKDDNVTTVESPSKRARHHTSEQCSPKNWSATSRQSIRARRLRAQQSLSEKLTSARNELLAANFDSLSRETVATSDFGFSLEENASTGNLPPTTSLTSISESGPPPLEHSDSGIRFRQAKRKLLL